jgi:hypothetical protein
MAQKKAIEIAPDFELDLAAQARAPVFAAHGQVP